MRRLRAVLSIRKTCEHNSADTILHKPRFRKKGRDMTSRKSSFAWIALAALFFGSGAWIARGGDDAASVEVKLEMLKWPQFVERIASNKDAKFTVVDAWATTCGPCKENFPHLIEMHRKYAKKGLAVI